jgi:hypothetical protein
MPFPIKPTGTPPPKFLLPHITLSSPHHRLQGPSPLRSTTRSSRTAISLQGTLLIPEQCCPSPRNATHAQGAKPCFEERHYHRRNPNALTVGNSKEHRSLSSVVFAPRNDIFMPTNAIHVPSPLSQRNTDRAPKLHVR